MNRALTGMALRHGYLRNDWFAVSLAGLDRIAIQAKPTSCRTLEGLSPADDHTPEPATIDGTGFGFQRPR